MKKFFEDMISSQNVENNYQEDDFYQYKLDYSQRLLDIFLDMAIVGIVTVFLFRVVCIETKNTLNDLILPFSIFMLIAMLYFGNKRTTVMKHYFNVFLIPGAGLLSAFKSIAQNPSKFYLNESFATWLICVLFSGIASTK